MKITTRKTDDFIELKVDEVETTVFKTHTEELKKAIFNLLDVANDLAGYTDKSVDDWVKYFAI